MEKRTLLTHMKGTGENKGRNARIWRITKGVLNAETGKIRVRLYQNGKSVWCPESLCHDVPHAESVARLWVLDATRLWGPNPI